MTKILIAEDERDIRELISLVLEFHGYDVFSVRNGLEALEKARSTSFDLILMDVRMPQMTGYEACRQLKESETTRDVPVIFLSAKGQESEVQTGLEAGAEDYILKPFAPDMLAETVQKVLDRQSVTS